MQDVALLQPKPGLVLVKQVLQGPGVHLVVEVHHLLRGLLDFWHCDWLSD